MDYKSSNLHITVVPTKLAKSASVMVGMKFPSGCHDTLQGLECGSCKCASAPLSSAFLYALYLVVNATIKKTYADELNSQVTKLSCNYQNGEFAIIASCTGTVSGIRKALCGIMKGLNPAKIYPAYKHAVKLLSETCEVKLSTDRAIFNYLADIAVKNLKSSVKVLISGKALFKQEQLDAVGASCLSKLKPSKVDGDKTDPKEKRAHSDEDCLVKCKGFSAILVKRYIESSLGVQLNLVDNCLHGSASFKSAIDKLKDADRIKRHVGTKYQKFKDDLGNALVFLATVNGLGDIATLVSYSKTKVSGASIAKDITANLK
jgi:hypothetical protein